MKSKSKKDKKSLDKKLRLKQNKTKKQRNKSIKKAQKAKKIAAKKLAHEKKEALKEQRPNFLIRWGQRVEKSKLSRRTFWPYIKLQLGLAFKPAKATKKSKVAISWILKVLVFALVLVFVYFLTSKLTGSSDQITGNMFLIVYITVAQIVLLIYSISAQIKRLYRPDDLKLILCYPISSFGRYLAEILAIYFRLLIYSMVVVWSILLVYGGAAKINVDGKSVLILVAMPAQYIFASLFGAFLVPLIPFGLSMILAIPFMYFSNWIANKNVLKLILCILLFIVLLVVYALLLKVISSVFVGDKTTPEIYKEIANFLHKFNKPYNICYFTSQICLASEVGKNFGIVAAIGLGTASIGIAMTKPLYHKFTQSGSLVENVTTIRKVKISNNGPYKEMFIKEFKQILRTPSYAYFYLGVAFVMPMLTIIISNLVSNIGQGQLGTNGFFGFSLLTILTIISLIGSYSANVISREGTQFYITKISPLPYRNQLLIKIAVNFIVAYGSLLLCLIAVAATSIVPKPTLETPGITWADFGLLFAASTFFLIGITFNGVMIELWRPRVNLMGTTNNETNIVIQLVISVLIAAIIAGAVLFTDTVYAKASLWIHLGALGIMIIYSLSFFLTFWFTCDKTYQRIEIK